MKLTSVELQPVNSLDFALLSFRDPNSLNPYNVKEIIGLDADEIIARYYGSSGTTTKFYNLSLEKRDVIIKILLNPRFDQGESYSSLRDDLYKLISSSRTGLIHIHLKNQDEIVAAISGFVTKLEAPHFEKEPNVQITIKCDDPMLKAMDPVEVVVDDLDPALTVIQDTLSTAPHGFKFEMTFLDTVASFNLEDPTNAIWSFVVTPVGGFLVDDVLYFSSEHDNKYLYIIRAAATIHLADVISSGSVWPIIFPGDNSFSINNDTDMEWTSISYYPTYWGV